MLVLSRKVDEQIIIGENVRVTVVSIRGNQVRLGFEAPPSVPIFREELRHEHVHQELPTDSRSAILCATGRSSSLVISASED
jgi:carbon storage regulator